MGRRHTAEHSRNALDIMAACHKPITQRRLGSCHLAKFSDRANPFSDTGPLIYLDDFLQHDSFTAADTSLLNCLESVEMEVKKWWQEI